jgi:hypothetical protein
VCFSCGFSVESMLGGEKQRGSINRIMGYSAKAQCTGKQAYLEPIRNSMQEPIGGRSLFAQKPAKPCWFL